MNNLQITLNVKELSYPDHPSLNIRLIYKKICINTNHELQKYENKASYALKNSLATINNQVKFKISKEFELKTTKIVIIFIGIKGRQITCLGEVTLDLFALNEEKESIQNAEIKPLTYKIGLDKTENTEASLKFDILFTEQPIKIPSHQKKIPQLGILKTQAYYKEELYISRRKQEQIPTAYQISRRNFKNVQITRPDFHSKQNGPDNSSGSYKRRFQYQTKRLEESQKRSRSRKNSISSSKHNFNSTQAHFANDSNSRISNLKVYKKNKSPSPRMRTPEPIRLENVQTTKSHYQDANMSNNYQEQHKHQRNGSKSHYRQNNVKFQQNYKPSNRDKLQKNVAQQKRPQFQRIVDQEEINTFRKNNQHQKHHPNQYDQNHHTSKNPTPADNFFSVQTQPTILNQQADPQQPNQMNQSQQNNYNSISSMNSQKQSKYKMITEKLELIESKIKKQKQKYADNDKIFDEESNNEIQQIDQYQIGVNQHPHTNSSNNRHHSKHTNPNIAQNTPGSSGFRSLPLTQRQDQQGSPMQSSCPKGQIAPSPKVMTPDLVKHSNRVGKQSQRTDNLVMSEFTVNSEKPKTQGKQSKPAEIQTYHNDLEDLKRIDSIKKRQSQMSPSQRYRNHSPKNQVRNNYLETQVKMLELQLQQSKYKNQSLTTKNEHLEKKVEQLQNQNNRGVNQNKELSQKISELKDKLIESYSSNRGSNNGGKRQSDSLQKQKKQLQEKLKLVQFDLNKVNKKVSQLQKQSKTLKKQNQALEITLSKKEKLIQKLSALNDQNNKKLYSVQQAQKKVIELDDQVEKLLMKTTEQQQEIADLKHALEYKQVAQNKERSKDDLDISRLDFPPKSPQKHKKPEDNESLKQELMNEKKKAQNFQAQLRYAQNNIRNLKMLIQNLKLEKKDLQQEIDHIAMNDEKPLAKKSSINKVERNNHYLSQNVKVQNQTLKQQVRLLKTQVKDLNNLLDGAIKKTNDSISNQSTILALDKSMGNEQKNLLTAKYRTLTKRLQIYENELRLKKNKMAQLINCVWNNGDANLIDQIDKLMGN